MIASTRTFVSLVLLVAGQAIALDNHSFVVDPTKSKITISDGLAPGAVIPSPVSSPLTGSFNLNLDAPSGSFNTRNWNVTAALDTLNVHNTQDIAFTVLSVYNVVYPATQFVMDDWNQNKGAIPTTILAGGPNISTGTITTEGHKNIGSILNGVPQAADVGWVMMPWELQVSDADWLGVSSPSGPTEAHISGFTLGYSNYVKFSFDIYGREVPEPATLSLLALGSLGLLRRSRRPA